MFLFCFAIISWIDCDINSEQKKIEWAANEKITSSPSKQIFYLSEVIKFRPRF